MLRRITIVLVLVLISSNTAFATNKVKPVLKISGLNSFFPVFSKDVKNYANELSKAEFELQPHQIFVKNCKTAKN